MTAYFRSALEHWLARADAARRLRLITACVALVGLLLGAASAARIVTARAALANGQAEAESLKGRIARAGAQTASAAPDPVTPDLPVNADSGAEFADELARQAAASQVRLSGVHVSLLTPSAFSFSGQVQGPYGSVMQFLKTLTDSRRPVVLTSLRLSRAEADPQTGAAEVRLSLAGSLQETETKS